MAERLFPGARDLSLLNLAAVLLGTVGGIGSLIAIGISPMIRGYNRISVFVAFLAFLAVFRALDRLHAFWRKPRLAWVMAAGLLAVGLYDQTTAAFVPDYDKTGSLFRSDAEYVGQIEQQLPQGAMVFQLPYAPFPEGPNVGKMGGYEHFRGYLHSTFLRWSHGSMRGGEGDRWLRDVAAQAVPDIVDTVARAGFAGIWVDRRGYVHAAASPEADLSRVLGVEPIVNSDGTLAFYRLRPVAK
jgi:phosphoglycerol transferase